MGVRESLLNTITSVADSDFVRIVTSAGASSKATVKNLFKGFESNLSAKSSLTTSDYIRVVGSDNEAYKQLVSDVAKKIIENYTGSSLAGSSQSVKSAIDALAVKTAAVTGGSLPLYVSRMGDVIFLRALYINPSSAITAGAWSTLGVLPTGYRPSATAYIGGVFTDASGRPYGFRGAIATNGTISGRFEDSISTSISLFGTVPVVLQ